MLRKEGRDGGGVVIATSRRYWGWSRGSASHVEPDASGLQVAEARCMLTLQDASLARHVSS